MQGKRRASRTKQRAAAAPKARLASPERPPAAPERAPQPQPQPSPPPAPDTAPQPASTSFAWTQAWYPVAPADYLEAGRPNALTLLGRELVVWRDTAGQWHAGEDKCPHRFAPLSEGRLEGDAIQCRYHGWAFEGGREGRCVSVPHADSDETERRACASQRSRLQTFPVQVRDGLLWIWPDDAPDAWIHSAATAPAQAPEASEPGWVGWEAPVGMMELPAGWAVMTENAMDPSHAPWVHHGLINKRSEASHFQMELSNDLDIQKGFSVRHGGYTHGQRQKKMDAVRVFTPPCLIKTHYTYEDGTANVAALYLTPVKPGVTRVFMKVAFKSSGQGGQRKASLAMKLFSLAGKVLPVGLMHAFGGTINDQDMVIQNKQEHQLAAEPRGWRAYNLATPADRGVSAFWSWLSKAGDVAWAGGASSLGNLPPPASRDLALSQWHRHTRYCPHCQKTVKSIDKWSRVLTVLAAAAGAGALLTASAGSPGLLQQQVVLVALAAGAVAVRAGLQAVRQRFFHAPTTDTWPYQPIPGKD